MTSLIFIIGSIDQIMSVKIFLLKTFEKNECLFIWFHRSDISIFLTSIHRVHKYI